MLYACCVVIFIQAVESTFQILSGENWSEPMFALMKSTYLNDKENLVLSEFYAALIACYFIIIHLIMTAVSKKGSNHIRTFGEWHGMLLV